jgi:hypothetical protein
LKHPQHEKTSGIHYDPLRPLKEMGNQVKCCQPKFDKVTTHVIDVQWVSSAVNVVVTKFERIDTFFVTNFGIQLKKGILIFPNLFYLNMSSSDYMTGFNSEFATEAIPNALPKFGNNPQKVRKWL